MVVRETVGASVDAAGVAEEVGACPKERIADAEMKTSVARVAFFTSVLDLRELRTI